MRLANRWVPLASMALVAGFFLPANSGQTASLSSLELAGQQAGPTATKCPNCPNQLVRFIGTDAGGVYQNALDHALTQADVYFGSFGADLLYTYRVLGTSGRRGGFAGFNDICVEIEAVVPAF